MDNDDLPKITSFTQYVEKKEFQNRCEKVDEIFYGEGHRNGLIGDVIYIKQQIDILKWLVGISVGVVSPILTAIILKYVFGI